MVNLAEKLLIPAKPVNFPFLLGRIGVQIIMIDLWRLLLVVHIRLIFITNENLR